MYKTQILATEEVLNANDELRRHEQEVANYMKGYAQENIPPHFRSRTQSDLAETMELVAATMENLTKLRTKFNHGMQNSVLDPLKELDKECSKLSTMNDNQKDNETQYIIKLRDAQYIKVMKIIIIHH